MNSLIYQGEVSHARLTPVRHSFRYPVYFYAFDLDELPELARHIPLFGYNRLRPVAVHDRDYLRPGPAPLREKLQAVLDEFGIATRIARAMLVTSARYFNYVFNPVSFFYCYDNAGALACILVQVNNTFGEMHLYLVPTGTIEDRDGQTRFKIGKQFHVSPFFSKDGYYEFRLSQPGETLDNLIHFHQAEQLALVARLSGQATELTAGNLLRTLMKRPFTAALTMPRILWQAARLYWQRRLPVYQKPVPDHAMTIRPVPSGLLERLGKKLCFRLLDRLPAGELRVCLPDGGQTRFGEAGSGPAVDLAIREPRFFRKVMLAGDIGFGESYVDGDWQSDDLPGLLTLLAVNQTALDDRRLLPAAIGRGINYLRHQLRSNTLRGSVRNIREHYDLSNQFFASFLDTSMTYSSARFLDDNDSLEQAQRNKLREIIAKAQIDANDHVLEIGCGWGSFAIEAVRATGCRVTGISLSRQQLELARRRVREAGLEERIDLKLCDYRQLQGRYSKIVSIEMLEAVGHAGLEPFFAVCDRALRPGGRAVIQVITIQDRQYAAYRASSDWIRKHIFPGGHLPSLGALAGAISGISSLQVSSLQQHGRDYARTLDCWRETLLARRQEILGLGYDDAFLRKWEYYFAYCRAGFVSRNIDLAQLILEKPA